MLLKREIVSPTLMDYDQAEVTPQLTMITVINTISYFCKPCFKSCDWLWARGLFESLRTICHGTELSCRKCLDFNRKARADTMRSKVRLLVFIGESRCRHRSWSRPYQSQHCLNVRYRREENMNGLPRVKLVEKVRVVRTSSVMSSTRTRSHGGSIVTSTMANSSG